MKNTKEPNHSNIDCEKGIGKNCPPREVSYNNSNWRYKKLASGFIKHSPSAEADITLRDTLRIIESDTIYIPNGVKVADNGKAKSFLPRF